MVYRMEQGYTVRNVRGTWVDGGTLILMVHSSFPQRFAVPLAQVRTFRETVLKTLEKRRLEKRVRRRAVVPED